MGSTGQGGGGGGFRSGSGGGGTGSLQHLNTTNFSTVELNAQAVARTVEGLGSQLAVAHTYASMNWIGEGFSEFQNLYYVIDQLMKDISDEFWDLYYTLCDAEGSYLEADQAAATSIASAE